MAEFNVPVRELGVVNDSHGRICVGGSGKSQLGRSKNTCVERKVFGKIGRHTRSVQRIEYIRTLNTSVYLLAGGPPFSPFSLTHQTVGAPSFAAFA
jgi:hypothetical protein